MDDATEVRLVVDVNDKASAALNKLAEAINRVVEMEKQFETQTKRLADAVAKLAQTGASGMGGGGRGPGGGSGGGGGSGSGGGRGGGGGGGGPKPKPTKTFDEEVDERVQAKLKSMALNEAVNKKLPQKAAKPVKSFDEEVADKIAAQAKAAKLKEAVSAKTAAPPKTFDQEVEDKVQARIKSKAMTDAVNARTAAPPKTFDQEVNDRVSKQRREQALTNAVEQKMGITGGKNAQKAAHVAGGFSGGGVVGAIGTLGPWGVAAAAGFIALDQGAKKAAEALNTLNDPTLTLAERNEKLRDDLIPLHESFRKLGEAIDGTAAAIARAERRERLTMATDSHWAAAKEKIRSADYATDQVAARASTYTAMGLKPGKGAHDTYDRSTALGSRQAAEASVLNPARDTARRSNIEYMAAIGAKNKQDFVTAEAITNADKKQMAADLAFEKVKAVRAKEDKTGVIDKAGKAEAKAQFNIANNEALKANAQAQTEIGRAQERTNQMAAAELDLRKANVGVMQAQLEVEKQREDRMTSTAQKLGSMNEADYEMSKEALKIVQQEGVENIPQELVDQAGAVAPEYVAKQREKLGEKRAKALGQELPGIDDSTIRDFQNGTLKDVREKVDKIKADIRVQIDLDEEEVAKRLANKLLPLVSEITKKIRVEAALRDMQSYTDETLQHQGGK